MKKLLLLFLICFLTIPVLQCQTGKGWNRNRSKWNQLDSAYFAKDVNVNGSLRVREDSLKIGDQSMEDAMQDWFDLQLTNALDIEDYVFLKANADQAGEAVSYEGMVDYVAANGGTGGGGYEWTEFIVGTTTGAPEAGSATFTISSFAGDAIRMDIGKRTRDSLYINEGDTNTYYGYRYNSSGKITVRPALRAGERVYIEAVPSTAVTKITLAEEESSLLTGLMGYWKLDETSGSTAEDSHSTADGTISGGVTLNQTGIIGKAYAFNGSTGNVNMGSACRPTEAISISLWFNIADITSGGDQWFVGNAVYSTNWCGYWVAINTSGQINFRLGTNTATLLDKTYESGLDDGSDHHVVCTWDGSNAYIYVDNVKSTATAYTSDIVYVTACNLHFGSNAYADGTFYGGLLDEPAIYNRALTDAEVEGLFDKTPYPFNE